MSLFTFMSTVFLLLFNATKSKSFFIHFIYLYLHVLYVFNLLLIFSIYFIHKAHKEDVKHKKQQTRFTFTNDELPSWDAPPRFVSMAAVDTREWCEQEEAEKDNFPIQCIKLIGKIVANTSLLC